MSGKNEEQLPALRQTQGAIKPYRSRHDGWTPDRQSKFIDTLCRTGCVRDACRAVGISSTSAYRIRRRLPEFAESWALALKRARISLEEVAWRRAVEGVDEDVYYAGKIIGTRKKYAHDILRLLILRGDNGNTNRAANGRFSGNVSAQSEARPNAGPEEEPDDDIGQRLEDKMNQLRERISASGYRHINIKNGEGITPEVIAAVQHFSATGSDDTPPG